MNYKITQEKTKVTPLKSQSGNTLSESQDFGGVIYKALRDYCHIDNTRIYQRIQKVLEEESAKIGAEVDRREDEW